MGAQPDAILAHAVDAGAIERDAGVPCCDDAVAIEPSWGALVRTAGTELDVLPVDVTTVAGQDIDPPGAGDAQ